MGCVSLRQEDEEKQDMAAPSHDSSSAFLGWSQRADMANSQPFQMLVEKTLPEMELGQIAREMLADEWLAQDNLLVNVLHANGARGMNIYPWVGRTRNLTFQLSLGIPWSKVLLYLRLNGKTNDAPPAAEDEIRTDGFTNVISTHEVTLGRDESLQLTSSYLCHVPVVDVVELRTVMNLRPHHDRGIVSFDFGAAVQSELGDGMVKQLMEKGFMRAARSYGLGIGAELESYTVAQRGDRASEFGVVARVNAR